MSLAASAYPSPPMAVAAGEATTPGLSPLAGPAIPPADPKDVLSSIGEAVYVWEIASDRLRWGPNIADLMGEVAADLDTGLSFARLVEPGAGRSRYDAVMDATGADLGDGVPYRTRYALLVKERKLWAEDTGRWFAGADGLPALARGVLRLERAVADGDLAPASTIMVDRAALLQRLDEVMAEQMSARRPLVILVAAIDDLLQFNDDFGHEATDQIVAEVQERLRKVMRQRDRMVRYSGNRFAILMTGCPSDQIAAAAGRFQRSVSRLPIETAGGVALVRLQMGAAHAPDLTRQADLLLSAAESALSNARQRGPDAVVIASEAMARRSRTAGLSTDHEALAALNERRIRLARQPVVNARTRTLVFHEALARIERHDGSYFSPGDLMPVLERRGLARLFDHRVLDLALAGLLAEPEAVLSVNVSAQSLTDPIWLDAFRALSVAHPAAVSRLIVEITETATIAHPDESRRALEIVKSCGARIAIDDFGAGHTSLRHLRDFPVDILKLDGAFVQNLARSTDDRFFVRTLLDLACHLGVETVAEWVDQEQDARLLAEWGVTYLQGNLLGAASLWSVEAALPPAERAMAISRRQTA